MNLNFFSATTFYQFQRLFIHPEIRSEWGEMQLRGRESDWSPWSTASSTRRGSRPLTAVGRYGPGHEEGAGI